MVVRETLAEVGLVFAREPARSAQAYADGFDLRGWVDGESGRFRHWPLGRAWIGPIDQVVLPLSRQGGEPPSSA